MRPPSASRSANACGEKYGAAAKLAIGSFISTACAAGTISGCAAMNAPSFSMSGAPVSGSGRRRSMSSRKSSGVRVAKVGEVVTSRSVSPPSQRSLIAIPRPSRALSEASGSPLAFENRISASTGSPCRCGARLSRAASGVAVKTPRAQLPFACSARWPGWVP